jgi:mRNA interferase MazF
MNQGEIWQVDFAPKIGDEIDKKRPALIVSSNSIGRLRLKVVVPITDPAATIQSWHVPLEPDEKNGLSKRSIADCFQVKSISNDRFIKRLGSLNEDDMDEVKVGLAKVLDLL